MKYIFSLSTRFSGNKYLSEVLKQNLPNSVVFHEMIGPHHFGLDTPEISQLMNFNCFGNNEYVKTFWERKFDRIEDVLQPDTKFYCETSSVLFKAGLIENLNMIEGTKYLICLKRKEKKVIKAFKETLGMVAPAQNWLFDLDQNYPKNMTKLEIKGKDVQEQLIKWLIKETNTRIEKYRHLFKKDKNIKFIDVDTEDLKCAKGVQKLCKELGHHIILDNEVKL